MKSSCHIALCEEKQTDIVAGKVTAVDAAGSTLSVTDEAGKAYTVTATKEETSIWKGDDTINLTDVKVGDIVELEYYKNKDGKSVSGRDSLPSTPGSTAGMKATP